MKRRFAWVFVAHPLLAVAACSSPPRLPAGLPPPEYERPVVTEWTGPGAESAAGGRAFVNPGGGTEQTAPDVSLVGADAGAASE